METNSTNETNSDRSFISSISKPFAFEEYFEELIRNSRTLNLLTTADHCPKTEDEEEKKVQRRAKNRER